MFWQPRGRRRTAAPSPRHFTPPPLVCLFLSILISCGAPATSASTTTTTLHKRGMCGNGIVEPDEQCDFNAAGSQSCCSPQCRFLPDVVTQCTRSGLAGVCGQGVCLTRQQQCSAFDDNILATSGFSVAGPFTPCTAGGGNGTDLEASCSLSCAGVASGAQQSSVCLDLSQYGNINNLVADGLTCGLSTANSTLGVCFHGGCRNDLCRATRCNNRGDCLRAADGQQVNCKCDPPYTGTRCERTPNCDGIVDYCGVCNGSNSTCQADPLAGTRNSNGNYFSTREFQVIVLPAICIAALLLVLLFAFFIIRSRATPPSMSGHSSLISSKLLPKSGPLHRVGISVRWDEFRCILAYEPQMQDELELLVGDIVFKLFEYDDGWAKGYNTRTQQEGIYPVSFTEKVGKANVGP